MTQSGLTGTTRVAYVERDSALRGFVLHLLREQATIEVVDTFSSAAKILAAEPPRVDALLLDADLGSMEISGIELALEMRARIPRLGVVLFTEACLPTFTEVLPPREHRGWSVVRKSLEVDGAALAATLTSTARGLNVIDPAASWREGDHPGQVLTPRQRRIMTLAAQGMDGKAIAAEFGLAPVTIRQELSRAYAVLVPDVRPGIDLRTLAVVRFLRTSTLSQHPVG